MYAFLNKGSVEQADPLSEEPQADLSQETETRVTVMQTPRADQETMSGLSASLSPLVFSTTTRSKKNSVTSRHRVPCLSDGKGERGP